MGDIATITDAYFLKSKAIIEQVGDCQATYAFFMRRPVICAPQKMLDFLCNSTKERHLNIEIALLFNEGDIVGAGEPLLYIRGPLSGLIDLETLLLQKLGPCCVAAYNAYMMAKALPSTQFMAMDARHCTGPEMMDSMAYAAAIGSKAAQAKHNAQGFVACANSYTAHYYANKQARGTMPHGLIGYAGSTLKAAQYYHQQFPDEPLVVLIDYFGQEITDALIICQHFNELAQQGNVLLRVDTTAGRYIEGLDNHHSYMILHEHAPHIIQSMRTEDELKHLVGGGVSAAAIWYIRTILDQHGYDNVKIIASSGFDSEKCQLFGEANAPVDIIGTGSFLPTIWRDTYATADIVQYNDTERVKVGREFLLLSHQQKAITFKSLSYNTS